MRVARFACTLFTGFLLLLLLFPPWSRRPHPEEIDPISLSLGHHWRFRLPYYWGYREQYCADSNGHERVCGGESVWVPDRQAIVDFRMLEYEAALGLVSSIFIALMVDWITRHLLGATSRFRALVSSFARRSFT